VAGRDAVSEISSAVLAAVGEELRAVLPIAPEAGVPFARLSTYRVGGPVGLLVRVPSNAALRAVATSIRRHRPPVLVVGRGSNLLMTDAGFAGVVLKLEGEFDALAVPLAGPDTAVVRPPGSPSQARAPAPTAGQAAVIRAGGAVLLPVLARRAAAAGWAGLEFYVGIPGSVGGALRMNAGGHGRETVEVLRRAWVLDLEGERDGPTLRSVESLELGYRSSVLRNTDVVTRAEFAVTPDDPVACEQRVAEIVEWRREHQPGGANAGSVFRNPPGDSAGRLIEASGLKGLRVGGAVVSTKHANFVQGEEGATSSDVLALIALVRARVREAAGVELETEVHVVGDGDQGTQ
jgi:UDP-N-acetylmuramate dehydrogenase